MSRLKNKTLLALAASLALVLVFALGCGTSDEPAQATSPAGPALGTQVGDQIHPFTMRLADGTMVTSASLQGQGRPTFLIYFKTP